MYRELDLGVVGPFVRSAAIHAMPRTYGADLSMPRASRLVRPTGHLCN